MVKMLASFNNYLYLYSNIRSLHRTRRKNGFDRLEHPLTIIEQIYVKYTPSITYNETHLNINKQRNI